MISTDSWHFLFSFFDTSWAWRWTNTYSPVRLWSVTTWSAPIPGIPYWGFLISAGS